MIDGETASIVAIIVSAESSAAEGAQTTAVDVASKISFFFQAEDGIRDFCLSRGLGPRG